MSRTSHTHHAPIKNLFVGPYAPTSPAYIQSLQHAAIPLIISQVVMAFEVFYTINNPPRVSQLPLQLDVSAPAHVEWDTHCMG